MEKIKQKIMTIKPIQSDSSACMPAAPSLLFSAGHQGSPLTGCHWSRIQTKLGTEA